MTEFGNVILVNFRLYFPKENTKLNIACMYINIFGYNKNFSHNPVFISIKRKYWIYYLVYQIEINFVTHHIIIIIKYENHNMCTFSTWTIASILLDQSVIQKYTRQCSDFFLFSLLISSILYLEKCSTSLSICFKE